MSQSTFQSLWKRFRSYPRAIQWLGYAVAAVIAFIVVNDYVWALGRYWNTRAADIERQVSEAGDVSRRQFEAQSLKSVVVALGEVEMPKDLQSTTESLHSTVTEVLTKYRSVSDDRFDLKGAATMPQVLSRVLPGKKIERISGELRFDANVDDAIAIIADLESRREIEAVTTVRMIRQPSLKKLRVNLTIDAWVISEGAPRRGVATGV